MLDTNQMLSQLPVRSDLFLASCFRSSKYDHVRPWELDLSTDCLMYDCQEIVIILAFMTNSFFECYLLHSFKARRSCDR